MQCSRCARHTARAQQQYHSHNRRHHQLMSLFVLHAPPSASASTSPFSPSDSCAQIDAQSAASSSSRCASSFRRFAARERGAPSTSPVCFLSSSLSLENPASLRSASSFSSLRNQRHKNMHSDNSPRDGSTLRLLAISCATREPTSVHRLQSQGKTNSCCLLG